MIDVKIFQEYPVNLYEKLLDWTIRFKSPKQIISQSQSTLTSGEIYLIIIYKIY